MPQPDSVQWEPTPVVLAPGLLCDARLWQAVQTQLTSASSVIDFEADASMEAMAARILREAPPRFVLAGFSMGGMAAIVAASQAAGRVAGLVILSTHGERDDEARRRMRMHQIGWADDEPFERVVKTRLMPAYFPGPDRPPFSALVEQMALGQGAGVFKRQVQALIDRPDIAAAARTLTGPTLVMTGAEDGLAGPALAQGLQRIIGRSRFRAVAGAGHFLPLEQPAAVADAIDAVATAGAGCALREPRRRP